MRSVSERFSWSIRAALARDAALADFMPLLREYRGLGLAQEEALQVLESLRGNSGSATEDRILEVMDVVAGWCAPHNRVWGT